MKLNIVGLLSVCCMMFSLSSRTCAEAKEVEAGFSETDITPKLGDKPVYMAGFGHNRKAAKVHDPLLARAVVLREGDTKLAIVSVDLVGFFHPYVVKARQKLPGFTYVLVSSTHNHEGPDTLGLWGSSPFVSGIDPDYQDFVIERIVEAVKKADAARQPVTATIGAARGPELLHDNREPYLKHDELVALQFHHARTGRQAGVIVQWNCHPETLDDKNTELSADYVGYTVKEIQEKQRCPVVYLTGTVGGLMTSLKVPIKDDQGKSLADGTFEKTERYGRQVGQLANQALTRASPLALSPIKIKSQDVYLPIYNKVYLLGRQLGVLERSAFLWANDPYKAEPFTGNASKHPLCMKTELAWLRVGDLNIAAIPGEIYPELVLGKVQEPADPAADFPDAPPEPAIYKSLPGPHRMIVGLANDEIGYIIPKRQWDEKRPFCYGRKKTQYGEINSVGPETAPILCEAFRKQTANDK